MPINVDHYEKCRNILIGIIEAKIPTHREAIESNTKYVSRGGMTFPEYESGYDPNTYREVTVNQILSSTDYANLYDELTSKEYTNNFTIFGNSFFIDIKKKLENVVRVGILMYEARNWSQVVEEDFKELYYSLYSDKFELKLSTVIKNLDSVNLTLLSNDLLTITIKKNENSSSTINYTLHDNKNSGYQILHQPGTVIDIVVGTLRIYKNPKIDYYVSGATYSLGCPRFIKTNAPPWYEHNFSNDPSANILNDDERNNFLEFFNIVMQSGEKGMLAIQRFSMACDRKSNYDKLLDLVFALEILLGGGGPDSIKHKIQLRLLSLLSSITEVRKELYEHMSSLYDARNTLVHGGHKKGKFYVAIANLENYVEIIRLGIMVFIKTTAIEKRDCDQMLERLDYDKSAIYEIDMSPIKWNEDARPPSG